MKRVDCQLIATNVGGGGGRGDRRGGEMLKILQSLVGGRGGGNQVNFNVT